MAGQAKESKYCYEAGNLKTSLTTSHLFPASQDEGCPFKIHHMPRNFKQRCSRVSQTLEQLYMSFRPRTCLPSWELANTGFELNISSRPQTCVVLSMVCTEITSNPKAATSSWALKTNVSKEISTINYTSEKHTFRQ